MRNYTQALMNLAVAGVVMLLPVSTFGNTIGFSDGTFNLSNYTINSYTTNGDTVSVAQTLTGGNPGAALAATINAPASGSSTSYAFTYALNNTFVYDPAVQGAITSISFSIDRDIASVTGVTLGSEAGTSIIFQGGNYYEFVISLPPQVGTWQTASMTGLVAANYALITNLTTDVVDASSHPNFAVGPITFGERTGWTVGPGNPASTALNVVDNISYNIVSTSSVPEPSTASLLVVSILLAGAIELRRKEKGRSDN